MTLQTPFANDAKTYGFEWLRRMLEASLQEGVLDTSGAGTDFKVTAAAGGGMKVDIAGGMALVKGDTGTRNALYMAFNDAAIANAVTLTASHASLPRIDQIVLYVNDTTDLAGASDTAVLDVVTGTATGGATLDNRTGATALPNNCVRLADVLVPAASSATSAGNIRDRRPWARGAFVSILPGVNTLRSTVLTSAGQGPDPAYTARLECSGAPLRISLESGRVYNTSGAGATYVGGRVDGVEQTTTAVTGIGVASAYGLGKTYETVITPAAGSHVVDLCWYVSSGTGTFSQPGAGASGNHPPFVVEELVRQNASNT